MEKEKLIFTRNEDYKGYNVKAWDLKKPNDGNALIEILKDEEVIKSFFFPAYKVYNIQTHFTDIVDTEIYNRLPAMVRVANYKDGYKMASWSGF